MAQPQNADAIEPGDVLQYSLHARPFHYDKLHPAMTGGPHARAAPDLGSEVWQAWSRLDAAITHFMCAQVSDMTRCAEELSAARLVMIDALRRQDRGKQG